MHLFAKKCPDCGKTKAYHRVPSTRYAPAAPIAFGGILLAMIFDLSRKPQFRCELCGTVFSSHTIVSRFFLIFWAWIVFWLMVIILFTLYGLGEVIWNR
jgi:rubredoxin